MDKAEQEALRERLQRAYSLEERITAAEGAAKLLEAQVHQGGTGTRPVMVRVYGNGDYLGGMVELSDPESIQELLAIVQKRIHDLQEEYKAL